MPCYLFLATLVNKPEQAPLYAPKKQTDESPSKPPRATLVLLEIIDRALYLHPLGLVSGL